jgi:hypothetical protein
MRVFSFDHLVGAGEQAIWHVEAECAFAVLRLMTRFNLVGWWTGRADGLFTLRIRPA